MKINKFLFLILFFTFTAIIYSFNEETKVTDQEMQKTLQQKEQTEEEFLKDPSIITNEDVTLQTIPSDEPINNHEKSLDVELIDAAISKDLSMVKLVLSKGVNINAAPYQGITALHLAATEGTLDIVKYLVENGADVNAKDDNGYTPLVYASSEDNKEVFDYLKSKGATK